MREMHFWPVRLALAYVPWPRWITAPGYHVGQTLLRRFGEGWGGDYKAIAAKADTTIFPHGGGRPCAR